MSQFKGKLGMTADFKNMFKNMEKIMLSGAGTSYPG